MDRSHPSCISHSLVYSGTVSELDLFHSFYFICISFMLFILGTLSSRSSDVWGFCVPAMPGGE
jgi:hypothetical protein